MRDFTLDAWAHLLDTLRTAGYGFHRHVDLASHNLGTQPHVLLRHDVDRLPRRAAAMAEIEAQRAITATYYFRTKSVSFDPAVIRAVADAGHEIGYHYENLADCGGNYEKAWADFERNLARFDAFGGVRTIAMHGRPLSRHDNRDLWKHYDYRTLGIKLEPYRDIDWSRYRYFTDTGRRWDDRFNRRDRVGHAIASKPVTTHDLGRYLLNNRGPVVISAHPERWTQFGIGFLISSLNDVVSNSIKQTVMSIGREN